MSDGLNNPVVLLSHGRWHIVERSRTARRGACGARITQHRAHSRLLTIGRDAVCPRCLAVFDAQQAAA